MKTHYNDVYYFKVMLIFYVTPQTHFDSIIYNKYFVYFALVRPIKPKLWPENVYDTPKMH